MRIPVTLRTLVIALGLLAGCGHSTNSFYNIAVAIDPPSASLLASGTQTFTANVTSSTQGVTWSVLETDGGTVTSGGLYTAPTTLGTYHVVATSNENKGVSATAVILVLGAPHIGEFTATPSEVVSGVAVVLQGTFSGGTGTIAPGQGAVASGQLITVNPTQDTTYTLTVTGAQGTTPATASVTVTMAVPPAIQSFLASSTTLVQGGSVTLTPTFGPGTGSISPDVGAVTSGTPYPVSPAQTTTYTLTVTGDLGAQTTSSLTITVVPPLVIASFSPSATTVYPGGAVILEPVFAGGAGVITPAVGPVISGDPYTVSPSMTTTYTLTVTNAQGAQLQSAVQVLVRAHGSFPSTGPIGTPRKDHTATLLQDGTVLLAGGVPMDENGLPYTALVEAERYNPANGTFSPVGAMTQARTGHAAVRLASGKVLVTGGNATWNSGLDATPIPATNTAELWDPATGQFTALANMTVPRRYHTATLLAGGQVLICGGLEGSAQNYGDILSSAELFDPAAGTFTALAPMTLARQLHQALALQDGTVLLLGGVAYNPGTPTPYGIPGAEIYTLGATPPFVATTSSMATGRGQAAAALMPNGQVFVAGGLGPAGAWLASTEIFTPVGQVFFLGTPLAAAAAYPVAALLAQGQVAVLGQGDVEVFDPTLVNVATVPGIVPTQSGLTATPLATGKVLVVNLEGAKLFDPLNP